MAHQLKYKAQQAKPYGDLPMLSHHDIMKRVLVPYPGREQSYTWYLQLRSNVQQYGLYLITIDEFQKDKSLCPTVVYGIKIEIIRYHDMKCTLYHFLAQRTIIGMEYTDLRNIINRQAITTDGYRVLYDIMERIHPALDPEAVFAVPKSADYGDIHEYYLFMTAYFMHESLAGRAFKPRNQINIFLKGLDGAYQPAISRIRTQMDLWNVSDERVPDLLQLANLPNLIERYLEEEGAPAIINRAEFRPKGNDSRNHKEIKRGKQNTGNNREYVDEQCGFCHTYGHPKHLCDRMTVWLHLKEESKNVDDKMKTRLQANYAEVDAKRRARRITKLRGTVRRLYQEGDYQAGDALLQAYLPNSLDGADVKSTVAEDSHSESEHSTSS